MLLISSGMSAGLIVSLFLRFVWAYVAQRRPEAWRTPSAYNEVLYVGSHCLLGAGLGVLFWLSWGLTALVDLSWWQRGVAFAVVMTLLFGLWPMLLLRSLLRVPSTLSWYWLIELAALTLAAGLNCSWQWQRAF